MVNIFNEENFEKEVEKSEGVVIVDFYADWCGPCKMMLPIVEEIAKEYEGKVKVCKVNTDDYPELARQFDVMSIPSFFFIKNGEVVENHVGGMDINKMKEKIEALLKA